MKNNKLNILLEDSNFVDFYCYKEDKWLQNAEFEEKLIAIFGSVENAEIEFENYKIENLIDDK
jgi:hypothetical protein